MCEQRKTQCMFQQLRYSCRHLQWTPPLQRCRPVLTRCGELSVSDGWIGKNMALAGDWRLCSAFPFQLFRFKHIITKLFRRMLPIYLFWHRSISLSLIHKMLEIAFQILFKRSNCLFWFLYTVSQKTVQNCFCQNFVKRSPFLWCMTERWQRG